MKRRMNTGGDILRIMYPFAANGDEDSKKVTRAVLAEVAPSVRVEILRVARTLVEWFEEVEDEKSAHRGAMKAASKKAAAKKAKKGSAK